MRRILAAACLVLAMPAVRAFDPSLWRAYCPPEGDAASTRSLLAADPEKLLARTPEQARQRACALLRRQGADFNTLLALGTALTLATQPVAAGAVLGDLETHPTPGRLGPARLQVALAQLAHVQDRHADEDKHANRALAQLRADDPEALEAYVTALVSRAAAARALRQPGALERAERDLQEAERVLQRAGRTRSLLMGEVLNQRTMLAYSHGKLDDTLIWALRERDLIRQLEGLDSPAQVDALITLGIVTSLKRRYSESLVHYAEAKRLTRLNPDASRRAYVGLLTNQISALIAQGRLDEAKAVSDESMALSVLIWGEGKAPTLRALERRLEVFAAMARYGEARQVQQEILAILAREGRQLPVERRVRLLDRAASFYERVNDLDAAEACVREMQALIGSAPDLALSRGSAARREGLLLKARGRWIEADRAFASSQEAWLPVYGAKDMTVVGLGALRCEVQARAGGAATACQALERDIEALDKAPAVDRATAHRALASEARAAGLQDRAREHLLQAVAAAQSPSGRSALWRVLQETAIHLREIGEPAKAVAVAKAAVAEVESVRQQLRGARELEGTYLQDKYRLYRTLADWLAEDSRIDESVQVQRMLKGEEYADFLRGQDRRLSGTQIPTYWTGRERRWLASLLAEPPPMPVDGRGDADFVRIKVQEAATRRKWAAALSAPLPAIAARTDPLRPPDAPPGESELRATLFLGPTHLNILIETRARRVLVRRPGDAAGLSRDIGRLLAQIEAREEARPALRDLYERVAAPIADEARRQGISRWTLRLDGDLRYLPFAALHDGQQHLLERFVIAQQTHGSGPRADMPGDRGAWLHAFGSTRGGDGMPPLKGVGDEICGIVAGEVTGGVGCSIRSPAGVPGHAWLDEAFTRQRLQQVLAGGDMKRRELLHIGTHFVLQPGEIGRSWLQLGDGSRLQLAEMLGLSLQTQSLVTLSACQTGMGGGAEVEGLASVMLERGAGAVIASLWPVDDRSTATLMQALYGRLRLSPDPAWALREAQLQLLNGADARQRHPFHWASFFLSQRGG